MNRTILEENIYYYTNALDDSKLILKYIEDLDTMPDSYTNIMKWSEWTASNDRGFVYGSNKIVLWDKKSNTGNHEIDFKSNYIIDSIKKAFTDVANDFQKEKKIADSPILDDVIGINRYNTSTNMGQHADSYDGDNTLRYSMVLYYNDDYEGGEISFPNQSVRIKPEIGSLIIFPSTEPYIHESLEILSGSKYMTASFWLHPQQA